MSPLIEKETDPKVLHFTKYVRQGNRLAWGESMEDHDTIAHKNGVGNIEHWPERVTKVSDAGHITPEDGKLVFQTASFTCQFEGNIQEENIKTRDIAKELLGDENVW